MLLVPNELLSRPSHRKMFAGWLVSGFLFALLGSLLPVWGFHISGDYRMAGGYFLALITGILVSAVAVRRFFPGAKADRLLNTGCVLGSAAILSLALAPETVPLARLASLIGMGLAAGMINVALFETLQPAYEKDAAQSLNLAGIYFGAGCLLSAALVAGSFYLYSVTTILIALGLVPVAYMALYWRITFEAHGQVERPPLEQVLRDSANLGAILFALLLFFQFANEWSVAGWLPLYLIGRLGISPAASLWLLSSYWLALTVGRVAAFSLLPHMRPSRVLFASAAAALFGCFTLVMTTNLFGAVTGILCLGGGMAPIYPLVAARIGRRFAYYHPGFFNGIFSVGLAGGLLAPAALGAAAAAYGLGAVMVLPAAGTCMVVLLLLLLWLETRITGR
jgi:MFS transporter, FHS family, glucose/mannose:H+ symporter